MDLYAENILEHFRNPRNKGALPNADATHTEENYACGDAVTLHIQTSDGKIQDLKWEGTGCAISQASMSLLSEKLIGMTMQEATQLRKQNILEILGIPVSMRRMKCALLCLHTLKNALRISEGKEAQSWLDTVEIEEE